MPRLCLYPVHHTAPLCTIFEHTAVVHLAGLCHTVPYFTILYLTIPCYTILCITVILHSIAPYSTALHHTALYHAVPHRTAPYGNVLCHIAQYSTVLYHTNTAPYCTSMVQTLLCQRLRAPLHRFSYCASDFVLPCTASQAILYHTHHQHSSSPGPSPPWGGP